MLVVVSGEAHSVLVLVAVSGEAHSALVLVVVSGEAHSVLEPVAVSEPCICPEIPVGKEVDFDIITTGAGNGQVQVTIVSPSGKIMAAKIEETIDGFGAKFTLSEPGPHTVRVMFAGQPVPDSPRTVTAVPSKVAPAKGDPTRVKAYGPGLKGGVANSPAEFTIDTRDAGPGGLGLTIEGPSEARIECFDQGNGTCVVRYWPTEPGEYTVNVLFADVLIPKAPFKPVVQPSKRVDVRGVKAYGPGLQPTGNHRRRMYHSGTRLRVCVC